MTVRRNRKVETTPTAPRLTVAEYYREMLTRP